MVGPAGLVVVGDREVQGAVAVEIRPGDAVAGPVLQKVGRKRVDEPPTPRVHEEVVLGGGNSGQEGRDDQVRQAVVVRIAPRRGRGMVVNAQRCRIGHVREGPVAVVAPQDVRPVGGDEEVQIAVIVIVGHRRDHAAVLVSPVRVVHAERGSDVDEGAIALVAEEGVLVTVLIRDVDIQVAVPVEVEPSHADGAAGVAQPRFPCHVGEGPDGRGGSCIAGGIFARRAVVRRIAGGGIATRKLARRAVIPEHPVGLVAHRDKEVQVAIAIVVDPAGLARRAHQVHPEPRRHIDKGVAVVAVEPVGRARGGRVSDVQIRIAIAIVVTPRGGAGVFEVGQSQRRGHIDEVASVVPVETVLRIAHPHEEVEIAVPIVVRPGVGLGAGGGEEVGLDAVEGGWGGLGVAGGRHEKEDDSSRPTPCGSRHRANRLNPLVPGRETRPAGSLDPALVGMPC